VIGISLALFAAAIQAQADVDKGAVVKALWHAVKDGKEDIVRATLVPEAHFDVQPAANQAVQTSTLTSRSLRTFVRECRIYDWGTETEGDAGEPVWLMTWTCPKEERGLIFHFAGNRISRVEDVPAPPPMVAIGGPQPPAIFPEEQR
jgi:hypothetical protein